MATSPSTWPKPRDFGQGVWPDGSGIRLYPESGFLLEICGENRDCRTITGDLRLTKRGRSRTIREKLLGFIVPFLGRWAEPCRPGIDAGSPERPRPVRSPRSPLPSLVPEASRCGASAAGLKPPPRETPSTGFEPHRAGGGRPAVNGGPTRRRQRPVNGPAEARW